MRLLRRHRCHATLTSGATHQMASWAEQNPSNQELNLHQRTTIEKVTVGSEKCKTSVIGFKDVNIFVIISLNANNLHQSRTALRQTKCERTTVCV